MCGDETNQTAAQASYESAVAIAKPGFVMPEPDVHCDDSGDPHPIEKIDWDELDLDRYLAMCG